VLDGLRLGPQLPQDVGSDIFLVRFFFLVLFLLLFSFFQQFMAPPQQKFSLESSAI